MSQNGSLSRGALKKGGEDLAEATYLILDRAEVGEPSSGKIGCFAMCLLRDKKNLGVAGENKPLEEK
jgi:hypothetical protein